MQINSSFDRGKDNRYWQGYSMSNYDSDYSEKDTKKRQKSPKFRDYYDEEDEKELHKKKKKLWKNPKRKKDSDDDWPE